MNNLNPRIWGLQFVFIWVSVGEAYHETLFLSYCDGYSYVLSPKGELSEK